MEIGKRRGRETRAVGERGRRECKKEEEEQEEEEEEEEDDDDDDDEGDTREGEGASRRCKPNEA